MITPAYPKFLGISKAENFQRDADIGDGYELDDRLRHILQTEPMVVAYPLFLLGLPLALLFPPYLALLLIPAWRNRSRGSVKVLIDHLVFVEAYTGSSSAKLIARP